MWRGLEFSIFFTLRKKAKQHSGSCFLYSDTTGMVDPHSHTTATHPAVVTRLDWAEDVLLNSRESRARQMRRDFSVAFSSVVVLGVITLKSGIQW